MSEYTYFQGKIKPKVASFDQCFELLSKASFLEMLDNAIYRDVPYIVLDTIDKVYASYDSIDEFRDILEKILPHLEEPTDLEYFSYGDGYYKLKLDPQNSKLSKVKISDKDPYTNEYTQEELINALGITGSEKVMERLFEVIKQKAKEGKRVRTPLGTFSAVDHTRRRREGRNPQTGEVMVVPEDTVKKIILEGSLFK